MSLRPAPGPSRPPWAPAGAAGDRTLGAGAADQYPEPPRAGAESAS